MIQYDTGSCFLLFAVFDGPGDPRRQISRTTKVPYGTRGAVSTIIFPKPHALLPQGKNNLATYSGSPAMDTCDQTCGPLWGRGQYQPLGIVGYKGGMNPKMALM